MAPRAYWKGYLKLSLVSCPVALYPASSASERVAFRTINRQTGNRLKQQMVDAVTGDVVGSEDKGKGYEVARDRFLLVEDEELDRVAIESTHTIDIERFVPREEVDQRYFDSPYYIGPTDTVGQEAFAVIREAMRQKNVVGLGRVVLYRRERILMLEPFDKGLLATSLRYAYEVRDAKAYLDEVPDMKLGRDMIDLAAHIIQSKAGHFEPDTFEDRYENALVELLRKKQAGLPEEPAAPQAEPSRVINLMDALRRSVAAEGTGAKRSGTQRRATANKAAKGTARGKRPMRRAG
ncbi:MAG: end-binding protein Ku [Variibacter sp.]|jgi:DNA end-binding protein Ku|nr:end-binding protein Ku [Variibacter sp.]